VLSLVFFVWDPDCQSLNLSIGWTWTILEVFPLPAFSHPHLRLFALPNGVPAKSWSYYGISCAMDDTPLARTLLPIGIYKARNPTAPGIPGKPMSDWRALTSHTQVYVERLNRHVHWNSTNYGQSICYYQQDFLWKGEYSLSTFSFGSLSLFNAYFHSVQENGQKFNRIYIYLGSQWVIGELLQATPRCMWKD
jgi:hypothetical protein